MGVEVKPRRLCGLEWQAWVCTWASLLPTLAVHVDTCTHTRSGPTQKLQKAGTRGEWGAGPGGHSPWVAISTSLPPGLFMSVSPALSLCLCLSLSVSFPMCRSLTVSRSPSVSCPRSLVSVQPGRSLGPWFQPSSHPTPCCAAGATQAKFPSLISIWSPGL